MFTVAGRKGAWVPGGFGLCVLGVRALSSEVANCLEHLSALHADSWALGGFKSSWRQANGSEAEPCNGRWETWCLTSSEPLHKTATLAG